MMKKNLKIIGFLIIVTTILCYSLEASALNSIQISLVYPQKSNAPKRAVKRKDLSVVVKDDILVNIADIALEQINSPSVYVEYFLDNELIYSTENKQGEKPKKNSLGFILDTTQYPDGKHTLVVNLWDKAGPSAVGIREIIIQNQSENEN